MSVLTAWLSCADSLCGVCLSPSACLLGCVVGGFLFSLSVRPAAHSPVDLSACLPACLPLPDRLTVYGMDGREDHPDFHSVSVLFHLT